MRHPNVGNFRIQGKMQQIMSRDEMNASIQVNMVIPFILYPSKIG